MLGTAIAQRSGGEDSAEHEDSEDHAKAPPDRRRKPSPRPHQHTDGQTQPFDAFEHQLQSAEPGDDVVLTERRPDDEQLAVAAIQPSGGERRLTTDWHVAGHLAGAGDGDAGEFVGG